MIETVNYLSLYRLDNGRKHDSTLLAGPWGHTIVNICEKSRDIFPTESTKMTARGQFKLNDYMIEEMGGKHKHTLKHLVTRHGIGLITGFTGNMEIIIACNCCAIIDSRTTVHNKSSQSTVASPVATRQHYQSHRSLSLHAPWIQCWLASVSQLN
jgi:hypothetical protein